MDQLRGFLGIVVLLSIGFLLSTDRRRIRPRIVIAGVALQFAFAYLFLRFAPIARVFEIFAEGVTRVISFAGEGTKFIFNGLAVTDNSDGQHPWGFVFAIQVLPVIIFFASFMSVLYHFGVMQRVVAAVAWVIRRSLGVTGVEALSAAANIFLGQTEAPLTVKPFISTMTRSQIMGIMVPGFASIAGSVLAAYVGILGGDSHEGQVLFAKHLLTASMMSAPAGLVMAKIMLPETETPRDESLASLVTARPNTRNLMDAAAEGATEGMRLAFNVAAMLIAFVALLALMNYPLTALSQVDDVARWRAAHGVPVLSFQNILGYLVTPLVWTFGVEWADCRAFGTLLGEQIIATEFVAYLDLGKLIHNDAIGHRAAQIATYSLCGFANLPSIAIQIGGLSGMAPERRSDFASIGLRAMVAGALACWMTGCVAGIFIPA